LKPGAVKLRVICIQPVQPHRGGARRTLSRRTRCSLALGSALPGVRLVTWTIHTGCHKLVSSTVRPTRAVTPGCQVGYMDHTGGDMDHTGCHRLLYTTIRHTRVGAPGCQIGYVDAPLVPAAIINWRFDCKITSVEENANSTCGHEARVAPCRLGGRARKPCCSRTS
jgi:hypothetical protein